MEFQPAEAKKFFSTVRKEMALLATSLPEGIMVKTFEDRMVGLPLFLRCVQEAAFGFPEGSKRFPVVCELGPVLCADQGPHAHAVRGRPLPVRHPAAQHLPSGAPPLPLPVPVQRAPQPQPVRQRKSVCQPAGHLDRQGGCGLSGTLSTMTVACCGPSADQASCLSVFLWSQGTERWTSKSSLLQVLISIQG